MFWIGLDRYYSLDDEKNSDRNSGALWDSIFLEKRVEEGIRSFNLKGVVTEEVYDEVEHISFGDDFIEFNFIDRTLFSSNTHTNSPHHDGLKPMGPKRAKMNQTHPTQDRKSVV